MPAEDDKPVKRPSYSPTILPIVRRAAGLGLTSEEIAEILGVSSRTILNWQGMHPEFLEAMRLGKDGPNQRVVASLYRSALGHYVKIKKGQMNKQGELVEWEETQYIKPEVGAQIFFLKNRMYDEWNDRINQTGSHSFADYTDAQLAALVREKAAKLVVNKATDKVLEGAVVSERPAKDVTPPKA